MGFALETHLFPEGELEQHLDTWPVAQARLVRRDIKADPLFMSTPKRRSCKEPRYVEAGFFLGNGIA